MVDFVPWNLSPFFRKSVEAIPKMLSRKFGLPSQGRPQIESTIYYSREVIIRAIEEHGDAANVLPFFGIKLTNVMLNPDTSMNQHRLKDDGLILNNDGENTTFFFGRSVRVEADVIFFTNDNNQMIDIIQQIMLLGTELHQNMRISSELSMPLKLSINKDGISIPEMDTSSEGIAKFELSFPISLDTFAGMIVQIPSIKTVKVQGGIVSIDPSKLNPDEKFRVSRALGFAKVGDINTLEVEELDIGLADDIVSP